MSNCPITGFFSDQDISQLAQRLRRGDLTAVQITEASLDSISSLNDQVNAFCLVDREGALQQAEQADALFNQGIDLSPLQGIPVAIKDNIETANLITTMGSALFKDYSPQTDADCVRRLKQAAAVIIGKTNTHEFAYGPTGDCSYHGATQNPWDLTKISGGSSCGSAVAVATGMVPCAIGTDTGGSIRIPAALTGVIGFKPSYQRVSTQGVFPLSQSLDHVGLLAKSAYDIELMLNILDYKENDALKQQRPLASQSVKNTLNQKTKLKLGWLAPHAFFPQMDLKLNTLIKAKASEFFDVAVQDLSTHSAYDLEQMGAELKVCFESIQNAEAYAVHQQHIVQSAHLYQTEVLERLNQAKHSYAWQYVHALKLRSSLQAKYAKLFEDYDFLVMPTLPILATDIYQRYLYQGQNQLNIKAALLSLTSPWNVLGLPACNIPLMLHEQMPLGLQIIAKHQDDHNLIHLIKSYAV